MTSPLQRVAEALMTNGSGERATHLVLMQAVQDGTDNELNLGGRNRESVMRTIAEALPELAEFEYLRGEVKEWLCAKCDTVFPGPPAKGVWCVICTVCGGDTAPLNHARLRRAKEQLAAAEALYEAVKPWAEWDDTMTPLEVTTALRNYEEARGRKHEDQSRTIERSASRMDG